MNTYRIDLPWKKPPLSLNQRLHHMARYRLESSIKDTVCLLARSAKIPRLAVATVVLHYCPATNGRHDKDNLFATIKPAADGLVMAKVISDDHSRIVTPMVVIDEPSTAKDVARVYLMIYGEPARPPAA